MGWSFLYAIKTMPCILNTPTGEICPHTDKDLLSRATVLLLRRRTYECLRHAAAHWSVNDVSPKGKLLTAHGKHLLIFELKFYPVKNPKLDSHSAFYRLRAIPFCSMLGGLHKGEHLRTFLSKSLPLQNCQNSRIRERNFAF